MRQEIVSQAWRSLRGVSLLARPIGVSEKVAHRLARGLDHRHGFARNDDMAFVSDVDAGKIYQVVKNGQWLSKPVEFVWPQE